ncbi:MAG: MarR family transcriptional regulator [Ahrensia sp.]|nr:MarR family transcriptional regulator [Ahrensia sp.]
MASFDQSLPMILHRALDAVMPEFRELFASHNLTDQQWRVLRVLWEAKKVTSAELSARTLLPAPSLVGIIDRLENKGLVSRLRSVDDRRITFVVATEAGRALQDRLVPHAEDIHERLRASVSEAEWRGMENTLGKIAAHMNEEPSTRKTG